MASPFPRPLLDVGGRMWGAKSTGREWQLPCGHTKRVMGFSSPGVGAMTGDQPSPVLWRRVDTTGSRASWGSL